MGTIGRIKFTELVDTQKLQALMEGFSKVIGTTNAVIDIEGVVIAHAGWQKACTGFHRANAETCRRCIESDTKLAEGITQGSPFAIYRCHNGLIDTAAPIVLEGEHLASVFTGQFLTAPPDLEFFRRQAVQFGFDEASYLEAISRVPVLPMERVESITRLYAELAGLLADGGLGRRKELIAAELLTRQNRALEHKYRLLFEQANDGIFLLDATRFIDCNQQGARMYGLAREELIGRSPAELCPERQSDGRLSAEVAAENIDRAMRGENPCFEWRALQADGSPLDVEVNLSPVEMDSKAYLQAIVRDISERKRAEISLRIAATAFDSQEGVFVTDAQSVILRVNHAFTEITGFTAEEAVGRTPKMLYSGRHDEAFFDAMAESIRLNGAWQGEIWNRRKSGEVYPEWLMLTAVKDDAGLATHYVGTFTDITSRKTAEDEIKHLAFYDPLTQLPNRRLLLDRLQQALVSSSRSEKHGALLFIDLDNFKTLNDTLGHDIGDLLLQQVAQRLVACVRKGDSVARLGGDEFLVLLEDLSKNEQEAATQVEAVGEKILAMLNQSYQLASFTKYSTPSIGVTLFANHQETIDELLKRADLAMYQAKAAGRNTLRFFDPEMQAAVTTRAALEASLREAIQNDQLLLYYQAQVDGKGCLTGVEALVRWQHPRLGLVPPDEFIPLAEETGLILPLGLWVLNTACVQLAAWAARPEMAHLTIAVNVSVRQFHHKDFVDQVLMVLDRTGANPQRLKLELTESLLVDDVEDVIAKMTALKARGVCFSLDDFGTGYSSLSYLKRLPLDQLKIDQGFVKNIFKDNNDSAIAKMVISLADSLGLTVIAEGVEIETQRNLLALLDCHAFQGFLFSRPLPLDEFEAYVKLV